MVLQSPAYIIWFLTRGWGCGDRMQGLYLEAVLDSARERSKKYRLQGQVILLVNELFERHRERLLLFFFVFVGGGFRGGSEGPWRRASTAAARSAGKTLPA